MNILIAVVLKILVGYIFLFIITFCYLSMHLNADEGCFWNLSLPTCDLKELVCILFLDDIISNFI